MPSLISMLLWVSCNYTMVTLFSRYKIQSRNLYSHVFFVLLSDGDPKNYMAYYRRATVFLAMGKSKSALPDLSRVIELKPDFTSVSCWSWSNLFSHSWTQCCIIGLTELCEKHIYTKNWKVLPYMYIWYKCKFYRVILVFLNLGSIFTCFGVQKKSLTQGQSLLWHLVRSKLLQEEASGNINQSCREEFVVYIDELLERLYFLTLFLT